MLYKFVASHSEAIVFAEYEEGLLTMHTDKHLLLFFFTLVFFDHALVLKDLDYLLLIKVL